MNVAFNLEMHVADDIDISYLDTSFCALSLHFASRNLRIIDLHIHVVYENPNFDYFLKIYSTCSLEAEFHQVSWF